MLKHQITIYLRHITKKPLQYFIKVISLALGIALFSFSAIYAYYHYTFDDYPNSADIYMLESVEYLNGIPQEKKSSTAFPLPFSESFKMEFPSVKYSSRYYSSTRKLRIGENEILEKVQFADPDILHILSAKTLHGQTNSFANEGRNIIISRSFASKYFGDSEALNQEIGFMLEDGWKYYTISAIVELPVQNSSIPLDLLMPLSVDFQYEESKDSWNYSFMHTFIQLQKNESIKDINLISTKFLVRHFTYVKEKMEEKEGFSQRLSGINLADLHFYPRGTYGLNQADYSYIEILMWLGSLILLVACINYIIISQAQNRARYQESGIRKAMGAQTKEIKTQLIQEALFTSLVSFVISMVIFWLMFPFLKQVGKNENFMNLPYYYVIIGGLAICAICSIISHLVSSRKLVKSGIIDLVQNKKAPKLSKGYYYLLTCIQFSISLALIICTTIISSQLNFISEMNLGFDKNNVLIIPTYNREGISAERLIERMKIETKEMSSVTGISAMSSAFNGYSVSSIPKNEENVQVYRFNVEHDWLNVMRVKLIEGRFFQASRDSMGGYKKVVVNKALMDKMGWNNLEEVRLPNDVKAIGIVENFQFQSARNLVSPALLMYGGYLGDMVVRITSNNYEKSIENLSTVWTKIGPASKMEYQFLDERIDAKYAEFKSWRFIMEVCTLVSIIMSILGLYGVSSHLAEQRKFEMGVRKVFGASQFTISKLLLNDIIKMILFSSIAASILCQFYITDWLQGFAYRIELSPIFFIKASGIGLLVALITAFYHIYLLVNSNPSKILRQN